MPVSKKPRSKTVAKASPKAGASAALPDRRAMESFLAAIAGHRGDDATAKAQDVMYEAWERTTSRSRIALARKALGISPLCADAYVLLAEEARSVEEARDLYAKGVDAGELASGHRVQRVCQAISGDFSKPAPICGPGPVSRARSCSLATWMCHLAHYRDMLKLNPNDNQGIRYILAACLLRRGEDSALKELLAAHEDRQRVLALHPGARRLPRTGAGIRSRQ